MTSSEALVLKRYVPCGRRDGMRTMVLLRRRTLPPRRPSTPRLVPTSGDSIALPTIAGLLKVYLE